MKQLKRLLLMLCLIVAGAQSVKAVDKTYYSQDGAQYALYPDFYGLGNYAYLVNIVNTNTAKLLVVPASLTYNGTTYWVVGVREPITDGSSAATSTMPDMSGKVERLVFQGSIQIPVNGYSQPAFSCQSLKDIYFLTSTPAFNEGAYEFYFNTTMTPKNTITLHVADKTAAQIATLKTQDVFKDFKDIVPYVEGDETTYTFNQTIVRTGGAGTATFTYTKAGTATTTNIVADDVSTAVINDWASGDQYQFSIQVTGQETLQVLRNGQDVTNAFTHSGVNYTLVVNSQNSGALYTAIGSNPWTEATWVIKITGTPTEVANAISFADPNVKALCVQYWDTNGDGELSYEEAAAVEYITDNKKINGTRIFNNISTVTFFDELQYFTGLKGLSNAFQNCTSLQSVIVPACITSLMSTFKGCTSLKSVVIKGAVSRMQDAFYGCTALEKVTFEGNTTEIGENSFYNCSSLKTINLPESLTKINYNAFQNCTSLRYIYIPKNVSSIDGRFLWGCKALEAIVVDSENATYQSPEGCNAVITTDGKTFIAGCKNSTIPDGIETIGAYSLRGMTIKSIVIPASVTSIGEYAFSGCSSLESVECLSETPPTLDSNSMSHGNKANCVLTVPYGCASAYSAWANYFKEIVEEDPQNVKTNTVLNPDGMPISWEYNYADENQTGGTFTDSSYPFFFDDMDRTRISSVKLKVPINDANNNRPVRVLRDGEDVSYQFEEFNAGFLIYNIALNVDVTWEISYETSHRQTFIRKGGTVNGIEVEYDYPEGFESYYNPNAVGTPLYVDFPTYHNQNASDAYIFIDVEDGKTLKVRHNGDPLDVNETFNQTNGAGEGFTRYELKESEYSNADGSTLESLGFEFCDPATWEITIEDAHKMLNAYANNDVSVAIAKVVEDQEPQYVARENSLHQWVNEGETYEVRFTPMHGEELSRFDIGWNPIENIADETRLVKNDDGSYSFTISYDQMNEETFDCLAVFSSSFYDENVVEYMFIGDFDRVYASADYNNDVEYEGSEFMQENVVGYHKGKVIENGSAIGQDAAVEIWLPSAKDTFRAYRNGFDMTNQFVDNGDGKWLFISSDDYLHAPAVWTIINEDDLMKYDTNRDSKITIADVTKLVNKILGKE